MAEIGTYSSGYIAFTPVNILPESSDLITWDWMETISQYSQRFNKMVSYNDIVIETSGKYVIDYSSLGCDFFPPLIKVYERFGTLATLSPSSYKITGIDLTTATFTNYSTEGTFLFRMYL
jgi:hypothetical protein